jgi:hypothetical protein
MADVCLHLVPADGSKGASLLDCTEQDGSFEISEIPPGRYVIVVNDDNQITSTEPFGTFYHPNAARREDAAVFEIGRGDFVEDVRVGVPKVLETVTVEGAFLYSDGKPVVDESVEFKVEGAERDQYGSIRGGVSGDASARTDEKGRFKLKILKGVRGELKGRMLAYVGKFENCPKLDAAVKKTGEHMPELRTPALSFQAEHDLTGVELKFPFPGCTKAKD